MLIVDSHCHLNFPDFAEDRDDVITRARQEGVGVMQTICTKMHEFPEIHTIAQEYENIYCSVGVHPHEVEKAPLVEPEELIQHAAHPKVIGIGETGLDYYYEHSPRELQQRSFRNHIAASRETGLPTIIHTRDADDDTLDILKAEKAKGDFPALIHCFSSSKRLAEECIDMGIYISISGIVTFKKAEAIREAVPDIPLKWLLVETDSPYLAPVPKRGKRNEPAFTRHTNKFLAEMKGISEEECASVTTENFFSLFNKAKQPSKTQ